MRPSCFGMLWTSKKKFRKKPQIVNDFLLAHYCPTIFKYTETGTLYGQPSWSSNARIYRFVGFFSTFSLFFFLFILWFLCPMHQSCRRNFSSNLEELQLRKIRKGIGRDSHFEKKKIILIFTSNLYNFITLIIHRMAHFHIYFIFSSILEHHPLMILSMILITVYFLSPAINRIF